VIKLRIKVKPQYRIVHPAILHPDHLLVMVKIEYSLGILYLVEANWPQGCSNLIIDDNTTILYQHPWFNPDPTLPFRDLYWLKNNQVEEIAYFTNRDYMYLLQRR
jgi:hypothetical protein